MSFFGLSPCDSARISAESDCDYVAPACDGCGCDLETEWECDAHLCADCQAEAANDPDPEEEPVIAFPVFQPFLTMRAAS